MALPSTLLTPESVSVEPDPEFDGWSVHPVWANVDRPRGAGWLVTKRSIVDRLVKALMDGAVYTSTEIRHDVNGKTYVATTAKVLGRYMNADLQRLGY